MINLFTFLKRCYVVPCQHGMVRPRVVDGGDGLQIWRVVGNILNKHSRQTTRVVQLQEWREANKC